MWRTCSLGTRLRPASLLVDRCIDPSKTIRCVNYDGGNGNEVFCQMGGGTLLCCLLCSLQVVKLFVFDFSLFTCWLVFCRALEFLFLPFFFPLLDSLGVPHLQNVLAWSQYQCQAPSRHSKDKLCFSN